MSNLTVEQSKISRARGNVWLRTLLEVPRNHSLTNLQVTGYFFVDGKETKQTLEYDPSTENGASGGSCVLDVNLSEDFNHTTQGFYRVQIEYQNMSDQTQYSEFMYVSDVEFMYHCMTEQLFSLGECCEELPDTLIQKWLLLQGHQMAMDYHQYDEAKFLYKKMLQICGHGCGKTNTCGCQTTVTKIVTEPSCGCKV